ncbi:MAG: transcriptional regulator [Desulfobacterales bacterium]
MMTTDLKEITKVWPDIQPIFSVPHNEKDYLKLTNFLDRLIDEVGNDENHPLASLMETIGTLIETYESRHVREKEGHAIDALNALMEGYGLKQSDLSEIGSQGVVSEILSGKRRLNVRQIKILSNRFRVSPAVFI